MELALDGDNLSVICFIYYEKSVNLDSIVICLVIMFSQLYRLKNTTFDKNFFWSQVSNNIRSIRHNLLSIRTDHNFIMNMILTVSFFFSLFIFLYVFTFSSTSNSCSSLFVNSLPLLSNTKIVDSIAVFHGFPIVMLTQYRRKANK